MAVEWTNNFNDTQTTDIITAVVTADTSSGTSLPVEDFDVTDSNGNTNWRVGDEFTIENDNTLYSIVAIGTITAGVGTLTISPTLQATANDGELITKEDSYKGNHGSAEEHLRKRNLGLI